MKFFSEELWTSAGGVVLPSLYLHDQVYVIKPSNNYGPASFPKGKVDEGETKEQAALREVWEETGLKARMFPGDPYIGSGKGSYSITHYYVMYRVSGSPKPTNETEWCKLMYWDDAIKLFQSGGNKRDIEIANKARAILKAQYSEYEGKK